MNLDGSVRTIACTDRAREFEASAPVQRRLERRHDVDSATAGRLHPRLEAERPFTCGTIQRAIPSKVLGEIPFRDAEIRVDDPVRMREPDPGDNGSSGSRGYL